MTLKYLLFVGAFLFSASFAADHKGEQSFGGERDVISSLLKKKDGYYYGSLYQLYEKEINDVKDPIYRSICKIENNTYNSQGTGVLISHSRNPEKKAIITAAHVVDKPIEDYIIIFTCDSSRCKIAGEPYFFHQKVDKTPVDLAIFRLENYPNIPAAKRSYEKMPLGKEVFAYTAGYGCFYYPLKGAKEESCILQNSMFLHGISGYYKKVDRASLINWNLAIACLYKILDFFSVKVSPVQSLGCECLMSQYMGQKNNSHPKTKREIVSAPSLPGFSGGPLFNSDDEIIGINSAMNYSFTSVIMHPDIHSPCLNKFFFIYKYVEELTSGYGLGKNFNKLGGMFYVGGWLSYLYSILNTSHFVVFNATLLFYSLVNYVGVCTDAKYLSLKCSSRKNHFSFAILLEPWNQLIDDYMDKSFA